MEDTASIMKRDFRNRAGRTFRMINGTKDKTAALEAAATLMKYREFVTNFLSTGVGGMTKEEAAISTKEIMNLAASRISDNPLIQYLLSEDSKSNDAKNQAMLKSTDLKSFRN